MKTKTFLSSLLLVMFAIQINAQEKPKEEFKPSGKLWGLAFGDFYNKIGGDTIINFGESEFAKTKKSQTSISLRRIYLGYDYGISQNFTAHLLFEASDGILTAGGDRTSLIKSCNLEWKNFLPKHTLYIGQVGTTSFSLAEKTWAYRSVEKVFGDARKLLPSNDLGIRISSLFKLETEGKNKVGYHVMWATGKGSKPEDNNLEKAYAGFDASLLDAKVLLALNYDYEDQLYIPTGGSKHVLKSIRSLEGFIAYQHKLFTVGVEYVSQTQKNQVIDTTGFIATGKNKDTLDYKPMGLSIFARGTILKDKLYAFARYDIYNKGYQKGYKMPSIATYYNEGFLTVGLDYTPTNNVHFIPNIWMNSYTDMRAKPSSYDATKASDRAKYYERKSDMVVRLTFYYVFK